MLFSSFIIHDSFRGHAYLFPGTIQEWQPSVADFLAGFSAPDIKMFEQSEARSWGIAEVRDLIAWAHLKPYSGERKVALLETVERFTPQAADAFLKTLEEPPASTVFFLFTRFPGALRETIRSRLTAVSPLLRRGPDVTPAVAVGVPDAPELYRKEVLGLFSLPIGERLKQASHWAGDTAKLEERLAGWLAALRALLIGADAGGATVAPRLLLASMKRILEILRLVRETNSQPRLLLDSFMLLW